MTVPVVSPCYPPLALVATVFFAVGLALASPADGAQTPQQSIGAVTNGKLINATRLRNSRRLKVRFIRNNWGTQRMVSVLQACTEQVRRKHRGAHRLMIGDISKQHGGYFPPHGGHQSGREADVGFYMKRGRPLGGLWLVGNADLDLSRNLTFVECLLDSGDVIRIFLDRGLQAGLYRRAKRRGWTKAKLLEVFSYPRPKSARVGVIQHRGGHDNHFHIRVRCAKHEKRCQNGTPRHAAVRKRRPTTKRPTTKRPAKKRAPAQRRPAKRHKAKRGR